MFCRDCEGPGAQLGFRVVMWVSPLPLDQPLTWSVRSGRAFGAADLTLTSFKRDNLRFKFIAIVLGQDQSSRFCFHFDSFLKTVIGRAQVFRDAATVIFTLHVGFRALYAWTWVIKDPFCFAKKLLTL